MEYQEIIKNHTIPSILNILEFSLAKTLKLRSWFTLYLNKISTNSLMIFFFINVHEEKPLSKTE